MITRYGLPLAAVALLVFAVIHVAGGQKVSPKAEPPVQPARSPFSSSVAGSGMIEAETRNIAVGSPTPGIIVQVSAKEGDHVSPGAELFRLDDRMLKAELQFRQAALASAQAELTRLENQPRPEQLQMSIAQVNEAEANVENMRNQLARIRSLASRRVATDEDLVQREQAYRAAQAKLEHARSEMEMQKAGAWEYDKQVAAAAVAQAQAQVHQVETELDRLIVRSLVSGTVLQVNVRPGEFVAAPAKDALVVIGSVQTLHVRVDVDEYDIPRFSSGAPARAVLKGRPEIEFPLQFVRIDPYVIPKRSLTGDNTERVDTRVLQVIYSMDPRGRELYVGQQVDVFIDVSKASSAASEAAQPASR